MRKDGEALNLLIVRLVEAVSSRANICLIADSDFKNRSRNKLIDFMLSRVVMVVGAGRGPLVRKTLAAAQVAQRSVKIYAVEKNPNAVVTLQAQQDENWGSLVSV